MRRRLAGLFFTSALLLVATCSLSTSSVRAAETPSSPAERGRRPIDGESVAEALRRGRFEELDRVLAAFAARFEGEPAHEERVVDAFEGFGRADPVVGRKLTTWIAAAPDSGVAQMALAHHLLARAWEIRGNGTARQTSAKSLEEMRHVLARADAAATQAQLRSPELVEPHRLRILIAAPIGDRERARDALEAALALYPAHYAVRAAYMGMLTRRWGGSYEALDQFAQEAQRFSDRNPRLRQLLGVAHWDRGRDLLDAQRYVEALNAFDRALEHGETRQRHVGRGRALRALDRLPEALTALDRAYALENDSAEVAYWRGLVLGDMERWEEALEAARTAIRLEPGNARFAKALHHFEARVDWQQFLERPTLDRALVYAASWLLRHAVHGAGVVLLLWLAFSGWRLLRAPHRAEALVSRTGLGSAPSAPAALAEPRPPEDALAARIPLLLWRSYLWLFGLLSVYTYANRWASLQPIDRYADLPITAIAFLGAIAFAVRRPILFRDFWKAWTLVFPCWNLTYWIFLEGPATPSLASMAFATLLHLPIYGALFTLGYRPESTWRGHSAT